MSADKTPYDIDLPRNPANFQPLTPLSFLERAAAVFPDRTAIIHGAGRRSYAEFYARARRLASALARRGIARGDTVSALLANTPAMLECHYGVPMSAAVLNTINTRLDAPVIAFQLDHAEAKVLIVDREFAKLAQDALALAKVRPLVIDCADPEHSGAAERIGSIGYEEFLAGGDPEFAWIMPADEWDAISLNYTSGTTGDPKGVVYHHRGAYLLAIGNVLTGNMGRHCVYLWTLPMFHCNGWCFPWTLSVVAGTHVCLRQVRARAIYDAIAAHRVTHLCGAPIVMATLLNASAGEKKPLPPEGELFTAAAPPPWWRSRTRNGARRHAPSSSSSRGTTSPPRISSPGAASSSRATNARATWCSPSCRRPRPARSRSSGCATWPGRCDCRSCSRLLLHSRWCRRRRGRASCTPARASTS